MDWILSFMSLAVLALGAGAIGAWRRGARQHALLMVGAALVIAANLLLWTLPLAQTPRQPPRAASGSGNPG